MGIETRKGLIDRAMVVDTQSLTVRTRKITGGWKQECLSPGRKVLINSQSGNEQTFIPKNG